MNNLNKLYWLKKDVEKIENQIKELTILSAFEMSCMPSSNSISSPVENFFDNLDELRAILAQAKEKVVKEIARLESCLESIEDAEIRVLAKARYLECKSFEVIGEENHMDRRTVSRKLEKYFQQE